MPDAIATGTLDPTNQTLRNENTTYGGGWVIYPIQPYMYGCEISDCVII